MYKVAYLALMSLVFLLTLNISGQDISSKTLPSVAVVTAQNRDGTAQVGTGFLAIRDGVMVTALHLVRDAKRVTARFPGGDEYECTGIIDKDETRNAALVRIKVFGKPMLKLAAVPQPAGAKLSLAAVKEGDFGLLPVTVTEAATATATWAVLAGDIPAGNNGSAIIDAEGNVVGLLVTRKPNDKMIFNMIPAQFVLALDSTLPTQPWGQGTQSQGPAQPPATQATPSPRERPGTIPIMTADQIDALIAQGYYVLADNADVMDWASVNSQGLGYLAGVPTPVYDLVQEIDNVNERLALAITDDPLRQRVLKNLSQLLTMQKSVSETFIRGIVIAAQQRNWTAQAQDAYSRAMAQGAAVNAKILETAPDLVELEKVSPKFREALVSELRYHMQMEKRPSGYRLGVICYPRRPFTFLVVFNDGLAHEIGLLPGDTLLSVAGQDLTKSMDFEGFKIMLKQNLGKKLDATVERFGKVKNIKLKIPSQIPEKAIIR